MTDASAPQDTTSKAGSLQSQHDATDAVEYGGLKGALSDGRWTLRSRTRMAMIILLTLFVAPVQSILKRLPVGWWFLVGFWHRAAGWIMGLRVKNIGVPAEKGPVLFVANHISWIDIMVFGGRLPRASFVAKSEIAGWGAAGWLAGLHRTIFVKRQRRTDSANQRDAMLERLKAGHGLILFPESTSTDGVSLEPFKSSLFSVAEKGNEATNGDLLVQPVTISYTEINGIPLTRAMAPIVAWLGDVELVSHVRDLLEYGRITVTLEYHKPLKLSDYGNRKKLAAASEKVVREGLVRAHRLTYRDQEG